MTTTAHEDQFTPAPVEVTQEDIKAAEGWLMASRGFSVKIKPSHSLAQAFARHRTASAPAGEVEPVAWMYSSPYGKELCKFRYARDEGHIPDDWVGWTETPLYAHPPAPADLAALRAEIERLTAEVRRLDYSGIHTCWDECPRLPCAQRREIEALTFTIAALKAQIERLTERAAQDKLDGGRGRVGVEGGFGPASSTHRPKRGGHF